MESVLQKIRQSREDDSKNRADASIAETVVDGCSVKIRFDSVGDSKIMAAIQSMLITAHLDAAFAAPGGGKRV